MVVVGGGGVAGRDEDRFGLEYDLDVYNIVAVSDFNMGGAPPAAPARSRPAASSAPQSREVRNRGSCRRPAAAMEKAALRCPARANLSDSDCSACPGDSHRHSSSEA